MEGKIAEGQNRGNTEQREDKTEGSQSRGRTRKT